MGLKMNAEVEYMINPFEIELDFGLVFENGY